MYGMDGGRNDGGMYGWMGCMALLLLFREAVAETGGRPQASSFKTYIHLLLLFPQELEPSFSFCPLQDGALKKSWWLDRKGVRRVRYQASK